MKSITSLEPLASLLPDVSKTTNHAFGINNSLRGEVISCFNDSMDYVSVSAQPRSTEAETINVLRTHPSVPDFTLKTAMTADNPKQYKEDITDAGWNHWYQDRADQPRFQNTDAQQRIIQRLQNASNLSQRVHAVAKETKDTAKEVKQENISIAMDIDIPGSQIQSWGAELSPTRRRKVNPLHAPRHETSRYVEAGYDRVMATWMEGAAAEARHRHYVDAHWLKTGKYDSFSKPSKDLGDAYARLEENMSTLKTMLGRQEAYLGHDQPRQIEQQGRIFDRISKTGIKRITEEP